jgi:hypothetical protein
MMYRLLATGWRTGLYQQMQQRVGVLRMRADELGDGIKLDEDEVSGGMHFTNASNIRKSHRGLNAIAIRSAPTQNE